MPILPDLAPGTPGGATTAELIARTRDILAEESADFFDDAAEILVALNEGVDVMFTEVPALPTVLPAIDVVGGQEYYPLPAGTRVARWIWMKHNYKTLTPMSALEYADKLMESRSGEPTHFCTEFLGAGGAEQILLWPTPTADAAGGLRGFYDALPPALVLGDPDGEPPVEAVDPAWHAPFHFAPCYYAAATLLRKDKQSELAGQVEARFFAEVKRYRKWLYGRRPYSHEYVDRSN